MKTEELVNILSEASTVKRPFSPKILAAICAVFCGLVTFLCLGLRSELSDGVFPYSFWLKTFLLGTALVFAVISLLEASVPVCLERAKLLNKGFMGLFVLLLVLEWIIVPPRKIISLFLLPNFNSCLFFVTLYGFIAMLTLSVIMRSYAPADTVKAAGWIGIAGACAGALGYSIHCPIDSPTFIIVSYGIPVTLMFLLGRIILPPWLKW